MYLTLNSKKNRIKSKNVDTKETPESPIKLMKRMCEGPHKIDDLNESRYKSSASGDFTSPNRKRGALNKKTKYPPYWDKMREKK